MPEGSAKWLGLMMDEAGKCGAALAFRTTFNMSATTESGHWVCLVPALGSLLCMITRLDDLEDKRCDTPTF